MTLSFDDAVRRIAAETQPAWLWDGARGRIVFANAAALAHWGEASLVDLGDQLAAVPNTRTVAYDIPGTGGGRWKMGPGSAPEATIRMDLCYLNVLASRRITPDEARAQGLAAISGNLEAGHWALDHMYPLVY